MAGRDDHRHVGAGADVPQQVEAIVAAEPEVEDDDSLAACAAWLCRRR
jgi:hypothetical protein